MDHSHLKIVSLRAFISQLNCMLHLIDRDTERRKQGLLPNLPVIKTNYLSFSSRYNVIHVLLLTLSIQFVDTWCYLGSGTRHGINIV